jgi:methylglyoxal reductase
MLYRPLGNSDIQASVVAFGAWQLGNWWWGSSDDDESIRAIHAAIDHGINLIDTAPIYGFGHSEEVVGRAIRDRRDEVVLATKCGLVWDKEKGVFHFHCNDAVATTEPSKYKIYKYLHPDSIRQEIEKSLKRLQTDYIDLYQTHWQEETTPIEDVIATLLGLMDEGKIRAIGVSNATIDHIKAYGDIDTDQERFSMLDRRIEKNGQLAFCSENNIAVLAYSPLEQGLLTGSVTADRQFSDTDQRKTRPQFSEENRRRVNAMLDQMRPIAQEHQLTLTQLVIAWTFSQPGLTHVLCGCRNAQQAIGNAAAGDVILSTEDMEIIDEILEQYKPAN